MTRLRHTPTGAVREFPDRWAAWQLKREGTPYELADEPAQPKRSTSKRTARKSTATRRRASTVAADEQGGTPDEQQE